MQPKVYQKGLMFFIKDEPSQQAELPIAGVSFPLISDCKSEPDSCWALTLMIGVFLHSGEQDHHIQG